MAASLERLRDCLNRNGNPWDLPPDGRRNLGIGGIDNCQNLFGRPLIQLLGGGMGLLGEQPVERAREPSVIVIPEG